MRINGRLGIRAGTVTDSTALLCKQTAISGTAVSNFVVSNLSGALSILDSNAASL